MFSVGEKICYPMHGVGVIESIEERTVLGETQPYYVLRFISGRMTAMVPVRTAASVGLRAVIGEAECTKVLAFLQGDVCVENDNWNQRYRDNYTKLRGGDIYDVADVIKCLNKRESMKGLSAGERKMLLTARQVMLAELVTATGKSEEEFRRVVGES